MPILFSYLLKLSCSLVAVYLFYQLALRRLTFYHANRWYLLGYSLLCFFIPLLNIAHLLEQHQLNHFKVVQVIPAIEMYTATSKSVMHQGEAAAFTAWDGLLWLMAIGAIVLLVRLVIQYSSLRRLSRSAQLVTDDGIKMYQVNKAIIPFSFGNAIYINQHQHGEAELREIIRHEFVHVRQRHTIDILFTEVLCILNWYNPASWAIRHAVRQNLEFIADNQVLQSGFDKKEYQYLLLKVMGLPQFRIATSFNFSALKKRIFMMNKMKSAKAHLVKFLFILPLLAVLLVAFRNVKDQVKVQKKAGSTFTVSGLVVDAATQAPLAHVTLNEIYSKVKATTDNRGYYSITIPVQRYPLHTQVLVSKEGFDNVKSSSLITLDKLEPAGTIEIIGMKRNGDKKSRWFIQSYDLSGNNTAVSASPTYDEVLKKVIQTKVEQEREKHATEPAHKPGRDTLPPPPPAIIEGPAAPGMLPDSYKDFLIRNPEVANIRWTERNLIIELKSGKTETYSRQDAKRMAEAEKKWGVLPTAPPPPPPPMVTPPDGHGPVSSNSNAAKQQEVVRLQRKVAQLNATMQNGSNTQNVEESQAYLNERSIALQKEQQALQEYSRENAQKNENLQVEAEARAQKEVTQMYEQQKALKIKANQMQTNSQKEQKEIQARLQKQQEIFNKKQETSQN